ncbi:MAG: hypothetical protein ACXVBY_10965, partial [Isosphaeraceae bacterium]
DRSNVWRSMLRIENQPGMSKLRLHATRLRTSLSTAPATTPVNRNAVCKVQVDLTETVRNDTWRGRDGEEAGRGREMTVAYRQFTVFGCFLMLFDVAYARFDGNANKYRLTTCVTLLWSVFAQQA